MGEAEELEVLGSQAPQGCVSEQVSRVVEGLPPLPKARPPGLHAQVLRAAGGESRGFPFPCWPECAHTGLLPGLGEARAGRSHVLVAEDGLPFWGPHF